MTSCCRTPVVAPLFPASLLVLRTSRGLHHYSAAFGIIAHVMPTFTQKPLSRRLEGGDLCHDCRRRSQLLSLGTSHVRKRDEPVHGNGVSVPTLIITIPSVIVVLVFAASLYGANIRFTTPMLFCLGFISLFISGGIGGFFLAQPAVDSCLHATSFVVGHFHFTGVGYYPPYSPLLPASIIGSRKCLAA